MDVGPAEDLGLKSAAVAHLAREDGDITGIILPAVAPNGYSGPIRLLVGISSRGEVLGVRVTPRAVVRAVHGALVYFDEHRRKLLNTPASTQPVEDH